MSLPEPSFRVSTLHEGYATPDVDAAVARVLAAFAGQAPLPTRTDIEALTFRPVRLEQGYDMSDVDGWFDLVADELDPRTWSSPTGAPTSAFGRPLGGPPASGPAPVVEPDLRVFDGRMAAIVLPLLAVAALAAWLLAR